MVLLPSLVGNLRSLTPGKGAMEDIAMVRASKQHTALQWDLSKKCYQPQLSKMSCSHGPKSKAMVTCRRYVCSTWLPEWSHHLRRHLWVTSRGMQLYGSACSERSVMATYYTGSISASPGYFSKLSPAIPNTVWKTSTMSPGRSASPPSSGSYMRQ